MLQSQLSSDYAHTVQGRLLLSMACFFVQLFLGVTTTTQPTLVLATSTTFLLNSLQHHGNHLHCPCRSRAPYHSWAGVPAPACHRRQQLPPQQRHAVLVRPRAATSPGPHLQCNTLRHRNYLSAILTNLSAILTTHTPTLSPAQPAHEQPVHVTAMAPVQTSGQQHYCNQDLHRVPHAGMPPQGPPSVTVPTQMPSLSRRSPQSASSP